MNSCYWLGRTTNSYMTVQPKTIVTKTINPLKCSGVRQLHLKYLVSSKSNLHFKTFKFSDILIFGHSGREHQSAQIIQMLEI